MLIFFLCLGTYFVGLGVGYWIWGKPLSDLRDTIEGKS